MSELIAKADRRKGLLKHLLLQLHEGALPDAVRHQLERLLGEIPYEQVVEVEQELLGEGLPSQEILKLCDIRSLVVRGGAGCGQGLLPQISRWSRSNPLKDHADRSESVTK